MALSLFRKRNIREDGENAGEDELETVEFIDAQRPGLHISTFLRQTMFDILYAVEYVVLLAFGFSSDVRDLIGQKQVKI